MMNGLLVQFHALIIGASGMIDTAFAGLLRECPRYAFVQSLHRQISQTKIASPKLHGH